MHKAGISMKLTLDTNHLLVGGKFTETDMSIGDPRIIIHHLVKNVYSNPKVTMIQEYTSNARDANVEAGKADTPIQIKVPSTFDPSIEIRDCGIGIHPTRMHDVFIKIGNSTKRDTNKEDGCFGIGSKIGFAYTDQFTVRTVCNEDGHLTLRVYSCVRRDDYSLKLMELGEPHMVNKSDPPEDQHTGTVIIIPVQTQDIGAIRQAVINKTEFWKVRPTITGAAESELAYPKREWFYRCDDFWFDMARGYDNNNIHAIVNGIHYPINSNRGYAQTSNSSITVPHFGGNIYLNFKTGEVEPALSRENLRYDDACKKLIESRIKDALAIIKNKINSIVNDAPSYLDAYEVAHKFVQASWLSGVEQTSWHGIQFSYEVKTRTKNIKQEGYPDHHIHDDLISFVTFHIRNGGVKNRCDNSITFSSLAEIHKNKQPIFYTNKKTICYKAIKHYISTKNISNNKYICFSGNKEDVIKWLERNHINELVSNLVDIKDTGYVTPKRGSPVGHKVITKWSVNNRYGSQSIKSQGTFDPNNVNDVGYYFIYDRNDGYDGLKIKGCKDTITSYEMRKVIEFLGTNNIFGVAPGNVKFLNKKQWKPFSEFFNDPENEKKVELIKQWRFYFYRSEKLENNSTPLILGNLSKVDTALISPESPFYKWVSCVKALPANTKPAGGGDDYTRTAINIIDKYSLLPKDTFSHDDLFTHYKETMHRYPMLTLINSNNTNAVEIGKLVTDYILTVDAQSKS